MSRLKKSAGAAALAVGLVGSAEGLRQNAYPDPATRGHPWTICYGHTGPEVVPGMKLALDQCKALLIKDLEGTAVGIERCIRVDLTDGQYVAVLSLAYNIGVGGVCKSSVVRAFNEGRPREACDNLLKFNRAAGFVMPGLTKRRERERALCLG